MKRKTTKRSTKTKPRVKQPAVRRVLTITIPLPRANELLTAALLVLGIGGLFYSLAPLTFGPRGSTTLAVATIPEVKKPVGMKRSVPTRLSVPDVGIDTKLIRLGKNPDGTMATPERYDIAGWYELSPTPGEVGPAVIVGHVDNYLGAAVFFRLKELQPGQLIQVAREDGSTAQFHVDKVELFDQQNFPTDAVYGNIDYPGIRLITCGGAYNPLTGRYSHNTVVYASFDSPES